MIDISRLSRNWAEKPVQQIGNNGKFEDILYDDLVYLYIECNLSVVATAAYLGIRDYNTLSNILKKKDICKSTNSKNLCRKTTNIEKYGGQTPFADAEVLKKREETIKERYNTTHQCKNKDIKDKIKKTNLAKYGAECNMSTSLFRQKRAISMSEKYGCEHPIQNEQIKKQIKETNKKKYGAENPIHSKLLSNQYYGTDYFIQSDHVFDKVLATKKKNNTFNTSIPEEEAYTCLVKKFGVNDVKRQYISPLYPFSCDFYIESLSWFVECNFNWTHGKEEYNPVKLEHIAVLNKWKEKSIESKYYAIAIEVWTIRDPKKRNTAMINLLNYTEVWDLGQLISIISNK